jgi:hypothetical protein
MGGADDFEHDAAALQMDVLSGLKTAVDIATPRKLSKWWDGHSDATVLQLQSEVSPCSCSLTPWPKSQGLLSADIRYG